MYEKNDFLKCVYYLFLKYALYFVVLAFAGDRFKESVISDSTTNEELFKLTVGYILFVLLYTLILIAFFSLPLYLILRLKNKIAFLLFLVLFFILRYIIYEDKNNINGLKDTIITEDEYYLMTRNK
ncbi:hypothetical protein SAMN05421741_12410 [Paenimyroides ummariense]|uniref:Uncharacterized protein n=1 Tax=Paenimyroides ummariense TaxID=913024 RepID=A0A1I5F2M3_9FLAO|nr:hypothetical protein [Paenimyroides ummariense]SFO17571.1 hypothetical protein SAMN05421741_12410 [Paenimyroides ummariense]